MIKCTVCKNEINELDESCPYCQIVFDDMIEEENKTLEERTDVNLEIHKEENNSRYL